MDLLFIDIECANCKEGGKLCEFGYVLTDNNFNLKQRENLLINPDTEFDPYVIKNMLNFTKSEYENSPKFNYFYDKIFNLLTDKNVIVVGHTIGGDAVHIGDDCIRYKLPTPDFSYVDIVELYKVHTKTVNATSLVKMCAFLGIEEQQNVHSADADAMMTMLVAKALCEKNEITIEQFINNYPQCKGKIYNYAKTVEQKANYKQFLFECEKIGRKLTDCAQNSIIRQFKKFVLRQGALSDKLSGKNVCLSSNFELTEYNKTLNLIQIIKNAGGNTVSQPTKCNVFVKYPLFTEDNKEVYCKKRESVETLKEKGKKIEIIEYGDFLSLLNIAEKDLQAPIYRKVEKYIKRKSSHAYSDHATPTTIGELLKNKQQKV